MKPQLACDAKLSKIKYPILALPKIDGVRAINLDGNLTGRSLKPHGNKYIGNLFKGLDFLGFDGELIVKTDQTDALCRLTTSAVNTHEGQPDLYWCVFDYLHPDVRDKTYIERHGRMVMKVMHLQEKQLITPGASKLVVVHFKYIENEDELLETEQVWLAEGYEGVILRDPQRLHKSGRATVGEGGYLRIKRFTEEDAKVLRVVEGRSNGNAATINALGHTERSSHQENMVPNGMVGALVCEDEKTGAEITVSAGCMTHDQRMHYFNNQDQIIGKVIKYKHFAVGRKDKPRMPTFQAFRIESDRVF